MCERSAFVFCRKVRVCAGVAVLATIFSGAGGAQEAAPQAEPVEEVVVTGSRIVRRDYSSDSPLLTVSSESLENTSAISIDQALNKLPQATPGANQFGNSTSLTTSPTASPGIATVNLRGLGENRTLVLIDGRRTQPANASLVVDLNTIPAEAIDSVEIITGGAGAAYGADAVAGVVNFKLKRNFSGVTFDSQFGQSAEGDADQIKLSALMGSDFADGRGNAMIGLSYADREAVRVIDRGFTRQLLTDPDTPGLASFPNLSGANITTSQAAVDTVFSSVDGYQNGDVPNSGYYYFNQAANLSEVTLFTVTPGAVSGIPAVGYTGGYYPDHKLRSDGTLESNRVGEYLSLPLERYTFFANGYYGLSDATEFYAQAKFNNTTTQTLLGDFGNAFSQYAINVPYDSDHPVPQDFATLLNARSNPGAAWSLNRSLNFLDRRTLTTQTYTYDLLAGFRGGLGLKDWTFDLFASHGRTAQTASFSGFADMLSYQTLVQAPNYGAGAVFENARIGRRASCTSGINPFLDTPVSQDCIDIIETGLRSTTDVTQDQVEGSIQGALFDLPAGEARFAVGADYRRNEFAYRPDKAASTTNIYSGVVGYFAQTPTSGSIDVEEIFAELLLPLLSDRPFVQDLSLNAGYRYSKYSSAGSIGTWKLTGDWVSSDWVTFRGGYQVANRAPNVAELFQPPVFQTVNWTDHDPCSNLTRASYGNVASNPDRQQVIDLCNAVAGTETAGPGGTPLIDENYVGNQPRYFPLGRDLQQGNVDLDNEEATTWTFGTVLRSPFSAPALANATLTFDYYDILIEGAIAPASTQLVYQECFNGLGNNPSYSSDNAYCQAIIRDPTTGYWLATNAEFQNLGRIHTSGIDVQLDWSIDAPGLGGQGSIFASLSFNWLNEYEVQNNAGGPTFDYAGTVGADTTTPPYGAQFEWKLYSTLGYHFGPGSVTLAWRHLPETDNYARATNPETTVLPTDAYDLFNLLGRWTFSDTVELRGGIENLFDTQPPVVGRNPGVTAAAGTTDRSNYDVLGRRFYLGATLRF